MVLQKNKKFFSFGLIALFLFVVPFSLNGDFFVAHAQWYNPATFFNWLLTGIQKLCGLLVQAGIHALSYAMDANFVKDMMGSQAVTESWRAIRDLCNLGFILTLLFSAFATIFQVKQYHIKTLILNIVLVALLINFSFPIVRFIVDLGNVPMYYIAQQMLGGKTTGNIIAGESNVICGLLPHYGSCSEQSAWNYADTTDASDILASIIMLFILGITLLVLAILLLIRTIALSILLIFSPLGFIGLAVPPLKKYANEYWDDLTKYTMFGPIMLLMIAISVKLMQTANAYGGSSTLGKMAKFAVPIVILWYGMSMGQKMGVAGASTVTGFAQKFAKNQGKRWSGFDWTKKRYDAYSAERKKRQDAIFQNNIGKSLGQKVNKGLFWTDKQLAKAGGKAGAIGGAVAGGTVGGVLTGGVGILPGAAAGAMLFGRGSKRGKLAQTYFQNERRESIAKKSQELRDSSTMDAMTRETQAVQYTRNAGTGEITVNFNGANAEAAAANARAYTGKQGDNKKAHIENVLRSGRHDFDEILASLDPALRGEINTIITKVQTPGGSIANSQEMGKLMSLIDDHMEAISKKYTQDGK